MNQLIYWALLTAGAGLCWWLFPPFRRARRYMRDVSTSGFLAPPPTARAVRAARLLGGATSFTFVGRVTVVGAENLPSDDESVMTFPNHSHPGDNFLMPYILNRRTRYMAGYGWMRIGFGLGALISGPMGAFCVNSGAGLGREAQEAATKLLVDDQSVNIFCEGDLRPDGGVSEFKTGGPRIAKEAQRRKGKPIKLIPMFMRYHRYAGRWVMRVPVPFRYMILFLNPLWYRRGVTVVFGKPIMSNELPDQPHAAAAFLRQRVIDLDPLKRNGEP